MSKHTLLAVIQVGDPDLGAELEAKITFAFTPGAGPTGPSYASGGEPGYAPEVEFVSAERLCSGKPSPFYGAFADMEQDWLDTLALDWLEENEADALDKAYSDLFAEEDAREEARNNGQFGVGA